MELNAKFSIAKRHYLNKQYVENCEFVRVRALSIVFVRNHRSFYDYSLGNAQSTNLEFLITAELIIKIQNKFRRNTSVKLHRLRTKYQIQLQNSCNLLETSQTELKGSHVETLDGSLPAFCRFAVPEAPKARLYTSYYHVYRRLLSHLIVLLHKGGSRNHSRFDSHLSFKSQCEEWRADVYGRIQSSQSDHGLHLVNSQHQYISLLMFPCCSTSFAFPQVSLPLRVSHTH